MPYEACDAFIDDAVRYSQMDKMHLKTLRSQVMAAKDLAFFERLFSTTSDKLLRAYSPHSIVSIHQDGVDGISSAGMG